MSDIKFLYNVSERGGSQNANWLFNSSLPDLDYWFSLFVLTANIVLRFVLSIKIYRCFFRVVSGVFVVYEFLFKPADQESSNGSAE